MYDFPYVLIRKYLLWNISENLSSSECILRVALLCTTLSVVLKLDSGLTRLLSHKYMPSIFFVPLLSPYRTIKSPVSDIGGWVQLEKIAQIVGGGGKFLIKFFILIEGFLFSLTFHLKKSVTIVGLLDGSVS